MSGSASKYSNFLTLALVLVYKVKRSHWARPARVKLLVSQTLQFLEPRWLILTLHVIINCDGQWRVGGCIQCCRRSPALTVAGGNLVYPPPALLHENKLIWPCCLIGSVIRDNGCWLSVGLNLVNHIKHYYHPPTTSQHQARGLKGKGKCKKYEKLGKMPPLRENPAMCRDF